MNEKKYRVIILGAGFSKPAGIPLANDLWCEILAKSNSLCERASKFNDDIDRYISYRQNCDDVKLIKENINFRSF
jgi:hypothetical protein